MKTCFTGTLFRMTYLVTVSIFFLAGILACNKSDEQVEITFTSWRIDDVAEMDRINALYTQEHPDVTIRFDSYDPMIYDSIALGKLSKGNGADLIFLWSYDKGRNYYDKGYLYDLNSVIPNLSSYGQLPLNAWTTGSGITYALPSVGVTHGVYYQKSFFTKYNIQEPTTWDEFIAACEKIHSGGETAIAQGANDGWTLGRIVFSTLGACFYGGETARKALIAGTAKLTDSNFLDAYNAVNSIKKYLPQGFATMGYEDARQYFATGKAAMFIGGSWEISVFEGLGLTSSQIGWFAPPVKKAGDKIQYCFHVDAGIGVNKKSKHMKESLEYLEWLSGTEYANALMSELPGFFSYTPGTQVAGNSLAQEMYNTISVSDLTVRLMFEKLNSKTPGGDALLSQSLEGMLKGIYTPQAAAAWVQNQLADYYK
jgi:raffinose/stachyose/melibiose transport system substrate-binding protein